MPQRVQLWAIMLRNCQETFILGSMSRKFLDTLEETITSSRTSPVARDRLLEYLAGATYEQRKSICHVRLGGASSLLEAASLCYG